MSLLANAASFLIQKFDGRVPKIGIVLGSGLSKFAESLQNVESCSTDEIPGGFASSVVGHAGKLVIGSIGKTRVAVLAGRIHGFESRTPMQVVHNLRALKLAGITQFILTNATGATRKAYKPGDLVLIKDHLNLTGQNPLVGTELFGGARFPDMSDAWSAGWRSRLKKKVALKEGTYGGLLGPSFETPAEIRMLRSLGVDLVGMSTVWENIALHQMGAQVLGISCVSNLAAGVTKATLSHQEVLDITEKVRPKFEKVLKLAIETAR